MGGSDQVITVVRTAVINEGIRGPVKEGDHCARVSEVKLGLQGWAL